MALTRRVAALMLGAVVATDVVVAACAQPSARMPSATPSVSSAPATPTTQTTQTTSASVVPSTRAPAPPPGGGSNAPVAGLPDRITLAFAGDVHFARQLNRLLTDSAPLTAALRDTLGRADFAMVNLETALGEGGAPLAGKKYTFRAPVASLSTLAGVGVDAVSMANNHAADFGDAVFGQSLDARRRARIPVVGIGRDETEAFAPLRLDVQGVKVAVLASSQIRDETSLQHAAGPTTPGIATNLDPGRLQRAVRQAAATSDLVVVMLHWGTQYTDCADQRQRDTARLLAADGADVIVGGHAHRPQGGGWFGPDHAAYVAYGLGNFVWYNNEGASAETGVLTLTVDAAAARAAGREEGPRARSLVVGEQWSPMLIGDDGVPRSPAPGATRARLSGSWETATRCAGLDDQPG